MPTSSLCTALGLTPFDTAAHTAQTADRFYGTHYSKARTWNAVPDTITWYDLPNQLTIYNVTPPGSPQTARPPACTIPTSSPSTTSTPCSCTATTA